MFVFDVSDTEGEYLPPEVERPFEVRGGKIGNKLGKTIENSRRDGVAIHTARLGSQQGGSIRAIASGKTLKFGKINVPLRYELELNQSASEESRYASLAHELAHLYCGHLGTPNNHWWPDRCNIPENVKEFEAESVAYMVCGRFGIDNPSEQYLVGYMGKEEQVPQISLECVMKAAGLIESMGRENLKPRKTRKV
ncbi:MAG: ImmA/IrrE family metallo-endopeptidase [Bacillota bacterium]